VGQADMFLQNGFDDFISKPIDIRQLNFILNKHIRDKQPPEVIEAAYKSTSNNDYLQPEMDSLLMKSFIRDAHKAVVLLEELCQKTGWEKNKEDLQKFTITVHGMKSSLWNIGEKELSELAYKLEVGGREQNIALIKDTTWEFLKDLRMLLKQLKQKQDENDANEDIEDLCNKMLAIQKMCAEYNRKGVLDILVNIKNCSRETRTVLDKIMECVTHSDFEEAENIAAEYINNLSIEENEELTT